MQSGVAGGRCVLSLFKRAMKTDVLVNARLFLTLVCGCDCRMTALTAMAARATTTAATPGAVTAAAARTEVRRTGVMVLLLAWADGGVRGGSRVGTGARPGGARTWIWPSCTGGPPTGQLSSRRWEEF